MDTGTKKDDLLRLTKENNRILRGMRRGARLRTFMRIVMFLVIIALAIVGYRFARPYIGQAQDAYNQVRDGVNDINETRNSIGDIFGGGDDE